MSEEIKELLFLLHNDRLTEAGKRKLEQEIERLNNIISNIENYIRVRAADDYTCSVCSVMIDDLLNILERSDKE